ncbi:hypothetical protein [Halobacteriovorax sp. YZS-1-1]|uniref:hypothetical protein n=1 Tax=unclassified Halobacteriovorax TaxID=2639665 RepID=UPI00399B1C4E
MNEKNNVEKKNLAPLGETIAKAIGCGLLTALGCVAVKHVNGMSNNSLDHGRAMDIAYGKTVFGDLYDSANTSDHELNNSQLSSFLKYSKQTS